MNKIKSVLKDQGLTQTRLARRMDLPFRLVNDWVNNRHQPSEDTMYKIAKALNVSIRTLTEE
jgi:transcriptional regulator with XRE-family HTH domain